MNKIFLPALALLLAAGCSDNNYTYYEKGRDALYFSMFTEPDSRLELSLARYLTDSYELKLPLELAGYASPEVRYYKVRVVGDSTTAVAGTHYNPLDERYAFRANDCFDSLTVTLIKTDPALEMEYRRLYLELVPTDDLGSGIEYKQYMDIRFTNGLTRPEDWAAHYQLCFGDYSRTKHVYILNVLELAEIPDKWDGDVARWDYCGMRMSQYFAENVVIDENGMQIQPWR